MLESHPMAKDANGNHQLDPFYCMAFGTFLPKDYLFANEHPLKEHISVIRFEDLKLNPEATLESLTDFLDIPMCETMYQTMFISLVRKYTRARKLTPRMLNELIEKIEVFNAEKVDVVWEQRLRIHYNCVGVIEIPELIPLPAPEVSVNTRKGVVVNYAPSTIAG